LTADELRQYFLAWADSLAEVQRLAAMEPSPAVDRAYAAAKANEEYDRAIYRRLRAQYRHENDRALDGSA
jgi:hypothetical protein